MHIGGVYNNGGVYDNSFYGTTFGPQNIRVADRKKFGFGPVLGPNGPPGPKSDRRTDRFETARTAYSVRTASVLH